VSCGRCFYCRRGQSIYCVDSQSFGFQLPGGYAEYMLVPEHAVLHGVVNRIEDAVSFTAAALAETLACCIRAQRTSRVTNGDAVAVIGGGPVGMIHCRLARANGAARVVLIEKEVSRLEHLDLGGIDDVIDSGKGSVEPQAVAPTGGDGADVVVVACSSAEAQRLSLSLAAKGGRVNLFGGLPTGQSAIAIDSNLLHYREISLQGTHGSTPDDNREALDMLARGLVSTDDLVSHEFPLDSLEEAFRFAEGRTGMHVAVLP
jgi:L-iditol 2-dehydrogenase